MKRIKWLVLGAGVSVMSAFAWVGVVHSQRFTTNVDKSEVVNSSVYSAGSNIEIKGTINGDIFCAGKTVDIDATVHGDVICAGSDVTIAGNIDGNIRVAGQTVTVSATVTRSVTIGANNFSLDSNARIGSDLTAAASTINLKGNVGRDAVIGGGDVTVRGTISRNVRASLTHLTVDGGTIQGNLDYTSPNKVVTKNGGTVAGTTTYHAPKPNRAPLALHFSLLSYLLTLFSVAIVGLVLSLLLPRQYRQAARMVFGSAGKSIAAAIVGGLGLFLLMIVLALTIIGLPLAGLLFALGLAVSIVAVPIAAHAVGDLVLRKGGNSQLNSVLVGTLILITLTYIPIIGWLAGLAAYLLGAGAALRMVRLWILRARSEKA